MYYGCITRLLKVGDRLHSIVGQALLEVLAHMAGVRSALAAYWACS